MNNSKPTPEQPINPDPSEIAKAFSTLGASKGGKARAKSLSPEKRSEIAKAAVEARWRKAGKIIKAIPKATHVGNLKLGDLELPCAVLENGTRVLSQRGVTQSLTGSRTASGGHYERMRELSGDAQLPPFLSANNLKDFIDSDLSATLQSPLEYMPEHGGRSAFGLEAALLPRVCDVWLKARVAGALRPTQLHIAAKAELLIRGLAHVGIIALVDEATGYQDARARDALAKILEAFVEKELQPYVKMFPPEYFRELYRLKGLQWPPKGNKMPRYIGKITNDVVYSRLAHGLRTRLDEKNPPNEKGYRKNKNTQWLTDDIGVPKLKEHLAVATALMTVSADRDYEGFHKLLDKAKPKLMESPLFDHKDEKGPKLREIED
jgi:ribosomal protein S25